MRSDANSAAHYAKALLSLAEAADAVRAVERDLDTVLEVAAQRASVRHFNANPFVATEGKVRALREIFGDKVHPVLLSFLSIVIEQGDFQKLSAIAEEFYSRLSVNAGGIAGEVVTAVPLSPAHLESIEAAAAELVGRDVKLRAHEDSSLIGGVLLRVGDFVVDASIRHDLEEARKALAG